MIVTYTDSVRFRKDTDDFGGKNMWHLQVKNARGHWQDVQWMDAGNAESLSGLKLPRFKKFRGKLVPK